MRFLIGLIKFYQKFISPSWGRHCRFYPCCSQYSVLSLEKYGLVKGSWKALKRIGSCHPWNEGGVDFP